VNPLSNAAVKIEYRTDRYPASLGDGTPLTVPPGSPDAHQSLAETGLANGTTYYYTAFVDNGSGVVWSRQTRGRPQPTSGPVKWVYHTGALTMTPPGIGSVYAVSNDHILHSMRSGALGGTWPSGWVPFLMAAPAQGRPTIAPVTVGSATKVAFVGSQDGHVYAVNAATGRRLWKSPNLGLVEAAPSGLFAKFGAGFDLILVGTRNAAGNSLYGLNLANGTQAWKWDNGGNPGSIGIIGSQASITYTSPPRVYFASREGTSPNTVRCLRFTSSSGTLEWSRALGDIDGSPTVRGSTVYVGTNDSKVHALDSLNGNSLWLVPFDCADGLVKGFVWPDRFSNALYLSTTNKVWKLRDDGSAVTKLWEVSVPSPSTPLLVPGGSHLLVGGGDGRLYQIEVNDPTDVRSQVLGDGSAAVGTPSLEVASSLVYVGTSSGAIYAVQIPLP
jgi:outer membrane protein assembly factor BamB